MVGLLSEPGPVGLHVALVVAVQRTEHPRPGKKRWPSPVGGRGNNRMPYETPAPTAAALSDRTSRRCPARRSTDCPSAGKEKPRHANLGVPTRLLRNGCEWFDAQLADFCIDRPAAAMVTRTASPLLVQTSGAHVVGIAPSGRLLSCGRALRPDACYATTPIVSTRPPGRSRCARSERPRRSPRRSDGVRVSDERDPLKP